MRLFFLSSLLKNRSEVDMSRRARPIPKLLAVKLRNLRRDAGLRQYQMRAIIAPEVVPVDPHANAPIGDYESGRRSPSYPEILRYARFGNVSVEYLIDDEIPITKGKKSKPKLKTDGAE